MCGCGRMCPKSTAAPNPPHQHTYSDRKAGRMERETYRRTMGKQSQRREIIAIVISKPTQTKFKSAKDSSLANSTPKTNREIKNEAKSQNQTKSPTPPKKIPQKKSPKPTTTKGKDKRTFSTPPAHQPQPTHPTASTRPPSPPPHPPPPPRKNTAATSPSDRAERAEESAEGAGAWSSAAARAAGAGGSSLLLSLCLSLLHYHQNHYHQHQHQHRPKSSVSAKKPSSRREQSRAAQRGGAGNLDLENPKFENQRQT